MASSARSDRGVRKRKLRRGTSRPRGMARIARKRARRRDANVSECVQRRGQRAAAASRPRTVDRRAAPAGLRGFKARRTTTMSQSKRPRTENETPSEKFVREHTSEGRAHYKQEADNALHQVPRRRASIEASRVDAAAPIVNRRRRGSDGESREQVYDIIANAGVSEKDPSEMTIREIQDEIYKLRRTVAAWICLRRVAAAPRPRRGSSVATSRGAAASRDVDRPWRRVAAAPRPRRGYSVETGRGAAAPRHGSSAGTFGRDRASGALEDAKHTCECTMSERPNCVVM